MATQMWFNRRMLGIPYTGHISNKEALNKIDKTTFIRNRQLNFLGNIMRK